MIGDSFIHPVKEFAVDTESGGIVALEFEKRGTAIRYVIPYISCVWLYTITPVHTMFHTPVYPCMPSVYIV